jgi:tripartite-type tricarboxylate transporter receptor subunit TctC
LIKAAIIACVALPCFVSTGLLAQSNYPVKPIRLVVGQATGGATDVIARLVSPKLSEQLGQQVIVEKRT